MESKSPEEWAEIYRERIAAAEQALATLPASEQPRQKNVIKGLKATLTKGPQRLKEAGATAAMKKRRKRTPIRVREPVQ